MAQLRTLAAADEAIRRDAHGYAHAIGLSAYTAQEEVGSVFARCTPDFQSGCYHGVIQAYFASHGAAGPALSEAGALNALCRDQRGDAAGRWLLFQCAHGMGHGLLQRAEYHLPTALQACDLVADAWEREACYGGVFMESIVQATVPHHTLGRPPGATSGEAGGPGAGGGHAGHDEHADHQAHGVRGPSDAPRPAAAFPPLSRADPLYPCNVLDSRYRSACYHMQTSAILFFNGYDVAATARACAGVEALFRPTCFQSLGRDISAITGQHHDRAIALCATAPAESQPFCHVGYAKNLIDLSAEPEDGFAYCRRLALDAAKRACYIAVGEEIWVLTDDPAKRRSLCEGAEPDHAEACRLGAGLEASQGVGSARPPERTTRSPA
jgi:hypothetical protein